MEAMLLYLLKSGGLIAVFYLAYHFLVRKETFFNSNRWFLLSGLVTSLLLPLFFIKKIILVERPAFHAEDLVALSQNTTRVSQDVPVVEAFDWMHFIWISYIVIVCLLVVKILLSFTSLYRMLYQQQIIKKENFKLVNLNENIAPFSFFNYIVYNADLYSEEELQSILLHESIHSREKHSLDILIAKIFCILFWFNPFVWLYKKAITQNLEYIADQKAIAQLEDKKSYQRALLKVVSHQSCLSITNNFYQSLIKKRIVMLNKNQSQKRNSWKYAIIIPVLIGFIFLFQIKIIAQEKEGKNYSASQQRENPIRIVVDKNSTDAELKNYAAQMKKEHGVTFKYSKVKRNSNGEITGIKVEFKDKNGNKGVSQVDGKEPIQPIHFYKTDTMIGFGKPKGNSIISTNGSIIINADTDDYSFNYNDSIPEIPNYSFDYEMPEIAEFPEIAELPEAPEAPEVAESPEAPEAPENSSYSSHQNANIIIKTDGDKKPVVIVNGKVLKDDKEIEAALKQYGGSKGHGFSYATSSDEGGQQIIINGKDIMKIKAEAMANARAQMNKMRPMLAKQMESARAQARADINRARREIKTSKPEVEATKDEMNRAKEEMLRAKAEMEAAKAAYEKARTELKTK